MRIRARKMTEYLIIPLAGLFGFMALKSLKNVAEYGQFDPAVLKSVDYKYLHSNLPDLRSPGTDFKAYKQPTSTKSYKKGVSIHEASHDIF